MIRRHLLVTAFAAMLLVALLWLFPLRVALALSGAERLGLSAQAADGTIWNGTIRGVALGGVPLGDARAALQPGALLSGRIALDIQSLADPRTRGTLYAGLGGQGVRNANLSVPLTGGIGALPVAAIDLANLRVHMSGLGCSQAAGMVSLRIAGKLGGLALPSGISGPVRCEGRNVAVLLASPGQPGQISFSITPDGRYTALARITASDEPSRIGLTAAGFRETPQGFVLKHEGRL